MTPLFLNAAIESLVAEIGRHEFKFRVLKRTAKALVSEIGQQNVQIPVYLGVYTHTHTHTMPRHIANCRLVEQWNR